MKRLFPVLLLLVLPPALPAGVNEGSYEILENGAGKFKLEIEGCPVASANVESITIEDLVIDERALGIDDHNYRVYGPGDAHYGSATIRSRIGVGEVGELGLWFDRTPGTECGGAAFKEIEITILRRDGSDARTINFHECFLADYRIEELPDGTGPVEVAEIQPGSFSCTGIDPDPGVGEVLNGIKVEISNLDGESLRIDPAWEFARGGARCLERNPLPFGDPDDPADRGHSGVSTVTGVEMFGPMATGRKALCQWINATTQLGEWERTLSVTGLGRGRGDGKSFTYFDAFPTRYVFPVLSASGTGNLTESVTVKPIRIEFR